jgi:hypothetical protein
MAIDITALYCCLDDFCKAFEDWEAHQLIPSETTRQRQGKLSRSEMLFIMVLFPPLTLQAFQGVLPLRDRLSAARLLS